MSEIIKELPDFNETYDQYQGRRPDLPEKEVPIEDLGVADREVVQTAMNDFAQELYTKYQNTREDDPNAYTRTHEEEQMTKTNVHLGEKVVDPSIPLTMDVYKNFTNERSVKSESINFYLYRDEGDAQEFVGNISIADRGDGGFDVVDRLVDLKFRKQGVGKIYLILLMLLCREFLMKNSILSKLMPICLNCQ